MNFSRLGLRHLVATLIVVVAVCGGLPGPVAPAAAQGEACFAETGFCIRGRFLDYWQQHGGLARNGYPLTGERREVLEDGREYTVQYFERVRLEYHPEHAPPYDVLLGQFGRRALLTGIVDLRASPDRPTGPVPGQAYFPETGHNLGGRFLDYWQANGGLAQFGYPLTEAFEDRLEDGNLHRVQYFERARFEAHSGNAPPHDVLLGQFGRQILVENDLLAGDLGFQRLYLAGEMLWPVLGGPTTPAVRAPGAYQHFERGVMLYRGDSRIIYVLCGDERAGRVVAGRRLAFSHEDTWREGEDPGGGPGPAPGLYEPRFGFGKLWRDNPAIRDCLGYATAPEEAYYTIREQRFAGGFMLAATTPVGRFIYVLYRAPSGAPIYERYPDPSP